MSEQLFDKYNIYDRCKKFKREWEITNNKNVLKKKLIISQTVQATNNMINKSVQNLESLGKMYQLQRYQREPRFGKCYKYRNRKYSSCTK